MTAIALSFCPHTTLSYLLRKNLLLRKLRKIFFVSVFLSGSRPSRPLPSFIVRCLRWLIRGCRRNQESMPSSPKVLMGGKNLEKFILR